MQTSRLVMSVTLALAAAGCADPMSTARPNPSALSAAFMTVPLGFSDANSSYTGDGGAMPSLWLPGSQAIAFGRGAMGAGMMGGGMHDAFVGGVGFGRGFGHHGPFGGGVTCKSTGTFSAATGRVTCPTETHDGLTINRSAQYLNTAGQVQQAFDTVTTNTVNIQSTITGTVSFDRSNGGGADRDGHPRHHGGIAGDTTTILTATTTVNHASNRTTAGLAQGSAQRTMNGTSGGTESTTGTSSRGTFTASRTAADTTKGLVVPIQDGKPTYPTAGTVTRAMRATVTYAGQAAATSTRREVVTYDGSATAKITIVQDGTTKTCTMPLPRGHLTCS